MNVIAANLVNLTPHAITIRPDEGGEITIPPSGIVARVETITRPLDVIEMDGVRVPITLSEYGKVTGIPDDEEGFYIVSAVVRAALHGEDAGIFSPDTGPDAYRENGQVVAVRRLLAG